MGLLIHNSSVICHSPVGGIIIISMKLLDYLSPVTIKICLILYPLLPVDYYGLVRVGELIVIHYLYIHPGNIIIPIVCRCRVFHVLKINFGILECLELTLVR